MSYPVGSQPQSYPGGPPNGQYPGVTPAGQYPGGPPIGQYQGGQPAGQYPGVPPLGQYPGVPPPVQYPGVQPAGQYQGGPPAGQYQGGQPACQYPGVPPPGQYPGGQPAGQYPGGPPAGQYPPQGQGYLQGDPQAGPGGGQQQWQGEMPEQDADDNPNAVPAQPTAPPLEKMDAVPGYQNIGFDGSALPPPTYEEAMGEPPQRTEISGLPRIDEKEARQALLEFVAENCCYGKGAAQDLHFKDLKHSSAFHYTLETFGEGRSTAWAFSPYSGQPIDGPQNGPAPGPWDIKAQPPTLFQNQKAEVEVPHTASVKPCHNCMAMGRIRCHRCFGRGRVRCSSCSGRGHKTVYRQGKHEHQRCHWCHGDGRRRCSTCNGFGMITCNCCQGHCQLKCYIKLTIMWTNHLLDHIVERTDLPDHLIRNVKGQTAFQEQHPRVWPINHFPDGEINNASQRIVRQHAGSFQSERILMQRHVVRIVPVTQALYKWKGEDSDFFVYGFEKKVYAPNYPQQCCCGCTLI